MSEPNKNPVGVLYPGAMGVTVAAAARNSGHPVYWASAGRSEETRQRAAQDGMHDLETLDRLCAECHILVSVCPPHAAEEVARAVIAYGFQGIYCDANAISPRRAQQIGELLQSAGIEMVDGGIIGGPARQPGETWLYLSGERAAEIASCFAAGPLETQVIGAEIGKASALKMCYAALTKGSTALLCAVLGAADQLNVRAQLAEQWSRDDAGAAAKNEQRVRTVTAKAWRFQGEMDEIADTFRDAGMPEGFHRAAAEVYERLASLRHATETPPLDTVLALLKNEPPPHLA